MSQKQKGKQKPKKQPPWNSFAYLAGLAKKKEPVIIHVNTNTIEDNSELNGIIIDADNYTIAFLTEKGRELLVFKHSIRYIEKVKREIECQSRTRSATKNLGRT